MDLKITVIPRAQRNEVIDLGEHHYRVKLTSAPERNKANRELIQVLAKYFGVKKSAVSIKTGQRSRHKIIQILQ
jgi:uncharacterized protein (TIGR00251 family)